MSGLSRRGVLRVGVALGGGLAVQWVPHGAEAATPGAGLAPGPFLRITPDDVLHLVVSRVDMGQGTATLQAQLVAEELEVDPSALTLELAGNDRRFDNPLMGLQLTGGSTSTAVSWRPYRLAGATARELLLGAAAAQWGVPRSTCEARAGAIVHEASGRSLRYGALADAAARLPTPTVRLKERGHRVVGAPTPRVDARLKVTGTAVFGLDVQVPGAKVAVVVRSPVPGGALKAFDATAAKALAGTSHVVAVPSGVAVVGETYFHARRAAQALTVEWEDGPLASFDTEGLRAQHLEALRGAGGRRVKARGDATGALSGEGQVVEAEYFCPYLAHAPLEPQNATAWVRDGRCEVWAPTQGPMVAAELIAQALALPLSAVTVHQTWVGGAFGRRLSQDYALEAAHVSKAIGGPVKVVWSREDDVRHSPYRPAATHRVRGALDASGLPRAWHHRVATQSILKQVLPQLAGAFLPPGLKFLRAAAGAVGADAVSARDESAFEGIDSLPYPVPNFAVDWVPVEPGVPVLFWRSVGHSHTAFATECFIDELAHAAGRDPLEYRRALLARRHRHRWVLELAAERLGWASPAPAGTGRGLAVHQSFGSYAAAAVALRVVSGAIRVDRLVLAIDCGRVVNPDVVRQQLESAAIFGLSATLKQRITFARGRVQQSNFHDYPMLRLNEVPRIETIIRENEAEPTGVGEPGVPVVAPAVANAVFALTGQRLRTLPLVLP